MKSVKPGRGPSLMGGIMSVVVGLFGVVWTVIAVRGGARIFGLFGVIFVVIAAAQAVYQFRNAAGKNRYSSFDITDGYEEPDPLNERFGGVSDPTSASDAQNAPARFCPYCGESVQDDDYRFCPRCGRRLP